MGASQSKESLKRTNSLKKSGRFEQKEQEPDGKLSAQPAQEMHSFKLIDAKSVAPQ